MPEAMDGSTQEAFAAFGLLDEETEARFEAERAATAAVCARLEEKYQARGLKFTQPFYGAVPVQAYGLLDGLRFYFRFRHNWGNLRLGPYDEEIERLTFQRLQETDVRYHAEQKARFEAGEISKERYEDSLDYSFARGGMAMEQDPTFLPTRIVKAAGVAGSDDPEDDYNGFLSDEESFELFSQLVETLEDVPAEEQLHERERVWLYEGLEAAEAWDKAWTQRWRAEHPEGLTEAHSGS